MSADILVFAGDAKNAAFRLGGDASDKKMDIFGRSSWAGVIIGNGVQGLNFTARFLQRLAAGGLFGGFACIDHPHHDLHHPGVFFVQRGGRAKLFDQNHFVMLGNE